MDKTRFYRGFCLSNFSDHWRKNVSDYCRLDVLFDHEIHLSRLSNSFYIIAVEFHEITDKHYVKIRFFSLQNGKPIEFLSPSLKRSFMQYRLTVYDRYGWEVV